MMSRIGRMMARKMSLRAAATPSGIPIRTQNKTAVTTIARVVIVSDQSPMTSTKDNARSVNSATPRPATRQAIVASTSVNTIIGVALSTAVNVLRTWVIGHCIDRKNGRKFGTNQSRTSELIQLANGKLINSDGLSMDYVLPAAN